LETASPGNQHCASCIGTLSFPMATALVGSAGLRWVLSMQQHWDWAHSREKEVFSILIMHDFFCG